MKIVCDSCSTKYSISDDKVRGKVFKIRCKKCSHIIVVKGTSEAAGASEDGGVVSEAPVEASWHVVIDGDQVGPLTDADVRARLSRLEIAPDSYVWKEGFADWQRLTDVPDFADVAPAAVAGELYSEGGGSAAASLASDAERDDDLGGVGGRGLPGNLFGGRPGSAARDNSTPISLAAAPAAGASFRSGDQGANESHDIFATASAPASSGSGSEGGDLFGMATPFPAPPAEGGGRVRPRANGSTSARHEGGRFEGASDFSRDRGTKEGGREGGRIENLTAQRSENSVLFSLSNLQSLASPSAAKAPSTIANTDGSGLIDIRAMAASTMRAPGNGSAIGSGGVGGFGGIGPSNDDLPAFAAFSSAAPVLLPLPSNSGPPKWVYAVIGAAVLMVGAVVLAAVTIIRKPVAVEPVAMAPIAPVAPAASAPVARDVANPPGAAPKMLPASELPPREGGSEPAGAADKGGAGDRASSKVRHSGKLRRGATGTPEGRPAGAASASAGAGSGAVAAPAAEPEKPKAAKGSLDDLLEGALKPRGKPRVDDDTSGKKASAAAAEAASHGPLSKAAVVAGMNGVKAKVNDCFNQFKVPGMAMVNVNIGKNGRVASAAVTGKFEGTPTGACVEKAVKAASFPPSDGLSTPYPFNLR